MSTLSHKAARGAYGTAIDMVLRHMNKDREKGMLQLVDLTERYMGSHFDSKNYVRSVLGIAKNVAGAIIRKVKRCRKSISVFGR